MQQTSKYYEHSGTIGLAGLIYMLILGTVGALVLGTIYGYAMFYIPLIYLNFLLTLGLGLGVGFLISSGGKIGKVRNSKVLLLFGIIFGLFAEYVGWVSWIFTYSKQEALVLMPSDILNVIQIIALNGAWDIFSWTPTGTALYFIWGVEALMIIGASTIVAWAVLSSTPFCERCNKWIEEKDSITPLDPINNPDELKAQLERGDYTLLRSLKKREAETDTYTQLTLLHCPSCRQNFFLTIKSIVVGRDSDNKVKRDENMLIENLIITYDHYRLIKEQWQNA